jgi:hypothetical protein
MNLSFVLLGLDMVWFVSSIILAMTVYLTARAVIKLPRYVTDRRRNFYPLQTVILVFGSILIVLQLVFLASNHTPPTPVFPLPTEITIVLATICITVVLLQNWYQRRLPLTDNQQRYRARKNRV